MEPIGVDDSTATTAEAAIDEEAAFESFVEEILGVAVFADIVLENIQENED